MKRPIKSIACIGEVMIELVTEDCTAAQLNVAGDTYNTAVYLKRLLAGRDIVVSYVTALGQDDFSQRILDHMAGEGLSPELVEQREDRVPGLYAIRTDSTGERSFTYWRAQSAARTLFQKPCQVNLMDLDRFDLIYLSGITLAVLAPKVRQELLHFLNGYRAKGGLVAFDSNYRPQLWRAQEEARSTVEAFWRICDIALPSADDEQALFKDKTTRDTRQRFLGYGMTTGALKRAAAGPLLIEDHLPPGEFAAIGNVVDTTAAGDSFNAGFLAALAIGGSGRTAAVCGHAVAADVIQSKGAIVRLSEETIKRFRTEKA